MKKNSQGPRLSIVRSLDVKIENLQIAIRVPEQVASVHFDSGLGSYDERRRTLLFKIGTLSEKAKIQASMRYITSAKTGRPEAPRDERAVAHVNYVVKGWVASDLRIDGIDVRGVTYSPYKVTRYASTGGKLDIRLGSKA